MCVYVCEGAREEKVERGLEGLGRRVEGRKKWPTREREGRENIECNRLSVEGRERRNRLSGKMLPEKDTKFK